MFKFKSHKEQNTEQAIDKKAFIFGLVSVFLVGTGFTIIAPVVPYLVQPYTNSENQAIVVTLLTSVYAFCVFFAAPGLGTLLVIRSLGLPSMGWSPSLSLPVNKAEFRVAANQFNPWQESSDLSSEAKSMYHSVMPHPLLWA